MLSKNMQTLLNFGITLVVFFIFCIIDSITFTWHFIMLLYPILCLVIFNIGLGMILSALYIFFRDIQYLWTVFVQLLMYMSAIFYSVDAYSETVQRIFLINPVYVYIKYFRVVVIDNSIPSLEVNVLAIGYALIAFGLGALIYKKCNHKFLYYV